MYNSTHLSKAFSETRKGKNGAFLYLLHGKPQLNNCFGIIESVISTFIHYMFIRVNIKPINNSAGEQVEK